MRILTLNQRNRRCSWKAVPKMTLDPSLLESLLALDPSISLPCTIAAKCNIVLRSYLLGILLDHFGSTSQIRVAKLSLGSCKQLHEIWFVSFCQLPIIYQDVYRQVFVETRCSLCEQHEILVERDMKLISKSCSYPNCRQRNSKFLLLVFLFQALAGPAFYWHQIS